MKQHISFSLIGGFKNAYFEDIISSVGNAKSTFYVFFESKEMLYKELLAYKGEQIEKQVWPKVLAAGDIR